MPGLSCLLSLYFSARTSSSLLSSRPRVRCCGFNPVTGFIGSIGHSNSGLLGAEDRLLGVGQAFEQIGGLGRGIVPGEVSLD